jgi:hypothetical protein
VVIICEMEQSKVEAVVLSIRSHHVIRQQERPVMGICTCLIFSFNRLPNTVMSEETGTLSQRFHRPSVVSGQGSCGDIISAVSRFQSLPPLI